MSKRTQRRAEQRRVNRIGQMDRKQNGTAKSVNPEVTPNNPGIDVPMTSPSGVSYPEALSEEQQPAAHSSPAQIAANRENAKHSTGPTSATGKVSISQNRTVHGLNYNPDTFRVLACEDQSSYDSLVRQLTADHKPTDTTEIILVTTMAQHRWLLDRANRLQEKCFDQQTGEITDQKLFTLYMRYATTHERAFHRCLSDLLKLRSTRQKLEIGFESEKRRTERHKDFLDGKEFDLQIKQTKLHLLEGDLWRAKRLAAREEKAQNAA